MIDLVKNFSITSRRIKGSVIRELLKLTSRPDIISLAGGLPSPDSFPSKAIAEIAQKVLTETPAKALQYTPTDGLIELKNELVKLMAEDGFDIGPENILVTASSQQGLDLVGRIFIDSTDPILVELPTYIGGLQAFSAYGASFVGVESDNSGIVISDLRRKLKRLKHSEEHYKFIYTVPDFQNPSGVTWTAERRKQLIELSNEYNMLVIDDSPYRELRFEGEKPPALHTFDKNDNVITLRSFSKIFSPGMRLGWIVAHPDIIKKLTVAKQSVDLCTSGLIQLIATEFLKRDLLKDHIKTVQNLYRSKRDVMINALEKHMPKEVKWMKPEGGLFMWITLPDSVDADDMFLDAVKKKVAYVVGSAFHCDGSGQNTFRVNFTFPPTDQIEEGIKRLAEVIKDRL